VEKVGVDAVDADESVAAVAGEFVVVGAGGSAVVAADGSAGGSVAAAAAAVVAVADGSAGVLAGLELPLVVAVEAVGGGAGVERVVEREPRLVRVVRGVLVQRVHTWEDEEEELMGLGVLTQQPSWRVVVVGLQQVAWVAGARPVGVVEYGLVFHLDVVDGPTWDYIAGQGLVVEGVLAYLP